MVLLFHESITAPRIVLTLCTPGCARTQSIEIDLITSKVRYSFWFPAELFTYGLRAWLTHARYSNSTNHKVRQTQVHSEIKSWDCDIGDPRTCTTCYLLQTWHGISKHRSFAEIAGQHMGLLPEDLFIAIGKSIDFICIKASQQFLLHVITHNCSEMHRIIGIPIITHSSLQPLSGRTFVN